MLRIIPNSFKKMSPRYGGYGANIVSVEVDDNGVRKMVTYWEEKGKYGSEIYQGPNYVLPYDSKSKSYSRNYTFWKGLPLKWMNIVHELRHKHQQSHF